MRTAGKPVAEMNLEEYKQHLKWMLIMVDYTRISRTIGYVIRNISRNDQPDLRQDAMLILIGRLKSKELPALTESSIRWHARRAAGTAVRNYIRAQRRNQFDLIDNQNLIPA